MLASSELLPAYLTLTIKPHLSLMLLIMSVISTENQLANVLQSAGEASKVLDLYVRVREANQASVITGNIFIMKQLFDRTV